MRKSYLSCLLLLAFSFAESQIMVDISQSNSVCTIGETTMLTANFPSLHTTTDYTVTRNSNYNPFPFTGGTLIYAGNSQYSDDFWSSIALPFNFTFYEQSYNQIQLGSNGLVTFDATYQTGDLCNWISGNTPLPNINIYPNSIYGVYQDLDFTNRGYGNINYYVLDTGIYAAPNRVFVYNIYALPNWNDNNAGRQTSQIVLHESSNIIEVNVERRVPASSWDGAGIIGIQNANATKFLTPTGRNTGPWYAQNEGWIFKPNGAPLPTTTTWTANGSTVGTGPSVNVTVNQPVTNYTATISYTNTDGSVNMFESRHTVTLGALNVYEPIDLYSCQNQQTIDLTVNEAIVTGGNAFDYTIRYYTDRTSAQNGTPNNRITTPANYMLQSAEQAIYMRIMEITGIPCVTVKEFHVSVGSDATPSGATTQYFSIGQTLNDLNVTGGTIAWYDAATGGNSLPGTTLLQNGVTYYAENISLTACQTKQVLAERLAVTAFTTLGNTTFNTSKLVAYPNPVTDILKIANSEIINQVDIYNAIGQLVLVKKATAKEVNVEVSALVNGVYFAQISSGKNNATLKFIKN